MLTALALATTVGLPYGVLVALLVLVNRRQRRRTETIATQIGVTEALEAEYGALVAPFVSRRRDGRWRVRVAVPLERAALVPGVLAVVWRELAGAEIVLRPRPAAPTPHPRGAPALDGAPLRATRALGVPRG